MNLTKLEIQILLEALVSHTSRLYLESINNNEPPAEEYITAIMLSGKLIKLGEENVLQSN